MAESGTPLRLPLQTAYDVHRFKRARHRLARQAPDYAPPLCELAAALEWTPEKTRGIAALAQATMRSLEASVGADQRRPLRDVLAAPTPGPDAVALHADLLARVAAGLHRLPARHQDIVRLRFGFATGEAWTLAQIGAKWGVSPERIRQLQDHALAHLRQHLGAPQLAGREEHAPGARDKR
jgi:DNA-directed RNA polymerase sigma subunit (sigma70/sigma32)